MCPSPRIAASLCAVAISAAMGAVGLARADEYIVPKTHARTGFTLGVAAGAGGFASTDCCDIGGRRGAGAFSLRVGTTATENMIWIVQLDSGVVLVRDREDRVNRNTQGTLTLGLQYYVRSSFWLKGGLGFASYVIRDGSDQNAAVNLERAGFGMSLSAGYDFLHRKRAWFFGFNRKDLVLSAEVGAVGGLYPAGEPEVGEVAQDTGAILMMQFSLGLQWY